MRPMTLVTGLLLVCFLTGCGTITNVVPSPRAKWAPINSDRDSELAMLSVYGGVKNDLWCIRRTWEASGEITSVARWVICPILALDLPLSVAGDTLTLPLAIPRLIYDASIGYYFPVLEALHPGWRDYLYSHPSEQFAPDAKSSSSP
jgi:uncharacterized protein YceK